MHAPPLVLTFIESLSPSAMLQGLCRQGEGAQQNFSENCLREVVAGARLARFLSSGLESRFGASLAAPSRPMGRNPIPQCAIPNRTTRSAALQCHMHWLATIGSILGREPWRSLTPALGCGPHVDGWAIHTLTASAQLWPSCCCCCATHVAPTVADPVTHTVPEPPTLSLMVVLVAAFRLVSRT
jgi:hypothetical protein